MSYLPLSGADSVMRSQTTHSLVKENADAVWLLR